MRTPLNNMFFYILPTCNNLLYRRAFGIQIHIYLSNIAECSDIADVAWRLSSLQEGTDVWEWRNMQIITLASDQGTFTARGSLRCVRSLVCLLPLCPVVSLFLSLSLSLSFSLAIVPLAWRLGFCLGTRPSSFYFRVRDALVCYLSSTLTSLLAAIILINISPIGGRREEGLHPILRSLPRLSSLWPACPRPRFVWTQHRGWEITRE